MGLFLFRVWPVVLPLLAYLVWLQTVRYQAKKNNLPMPHYRGGAWYWVVLASLLTALVCFLGIMVSKQDNKGVYTPSHMEGDHIIPSQVGKP